MNAKAMGGLVAVAIGLAAAGCNQGGGEAQHGAVDAGAAVGTTVLAGSLVEARVGHTATAVGDGMSVLIAGGTTLTGRATETAELWRAGHSLPLPASMTTPRTGHRAIALESGEVWIVGGRDARGAALRTTEVWSPTTREFRPGPTLRAARAEAAIGYREEGVVIAFGAGQDSVELWGWDLTPGKTIDFDDRQGRRGDGVASFEGDQLYLSGGLDDQQRPAPPIWLDLGQDGRAARRVAPGARQVERGTAFVATLDGAIVDAFVVGGRFDEKECGHLQRVRTDDEDVTFVAQVLVARERAAVVALPVGFVLAGGRGRFGPIDAVEVVDARGASHAPALNVARYDHQGTLLADGSVLFTGGRGHDELPVSLSELLVTPGGRAPDAAGLYADARAEQAAWERLVAERDAAAADVARLQGELVVTRADLDRERAEVARLQGELAAAEQRAKDLEAQVASLTADVARSRAEEQAQRDRLTLAQKELAVAQGAASGLQAQLAQATGRVSELEREQAGLRQELERTNDRIAQLEGQLSQPPPTTSGGTVVGTVTWLHPKVTRTGP